MDLKFSFNLKNYKGVAKQFESLKNPRHLRIMLILQEGEKSNDEVHEIMKSEKRYKHRENTYQAIEKLVKTELVNKKYDPKRKKILYSLNENIFKNEVP